MFLFSAKTSLVDSSVLSGRDGHDADGADGEQVEGRGPDDGAGAQLAALKLVAHDLDAGEQDLGRGAAQGHQGQVGDGPVPHGNLDRLGNVLL